MNSLQDASFEELHALLKCLELYDKSGRDDAARWRETVFAEMRRRFAELEQNATAMAAARTARAEETS